MSEVPIDPMIAVSAAFFFLLIVGLSVLATLAGFHWYLVAVAAVLFVAALGWLVWTCVPRKGR